MPRGKKNKDNDSSENKLSSLFDFDQPKEEIDKKDFFTVGEFLESLNEYLKSKKNFVVGEVTEFKAHDKWASFSLKDKQDGSILKCFLSIWTYRKSGVLLEDGMEIKVGGFPRIYKLAGTFSFNVESIEPLGEGSLKKAYVLLLKKLELEGLFARKRPFDKFIKRVGVISSKDGVVIHDFLRNLKPLGFKIDFYNSRVEGADAVPGIIGGIKWFNKNIPGLDILVLMRGGGSLESMQAFNNEQVCREIFASKIPVLCGIGHEVDVPIACLVADSYVSTPTATAYEINKSWDDILLGLPVMERQIFSGFTYNFNRLAQKIPTYKKGIVTHFQFYLDRRVREVGTLASRISSGFKQIFSQFDILSRKITKDGLGKIAESITKMLYKISSIEKMIVLANPERNLKLGYSIVFNEKGKVLKNIDDIRVGEKITTKLKDGEVESEVKIIRN
ncbi:MAG: exodeoxyribonuclease VII large subunit [bacterium]